MDGNHAEIVAALRATGVTVQSLAQVGRGCPDLLCGWSGRNVLLEVKASDGDYTPTQVDWAADWRGQLSLVRTVDEALAAVQRTTTQLERMMRWTRVSG